MHDKDSIQGSPRSKHDKPFTAANSSVSKNEITHTEFMNFLEPFFEAIDEKKFKELTKISDNKDLKVSEDIYKRSGSILKERLCSCYVFDDKVEIPEGNFETELAFATFHNPKADFCQFFTKYNILDDFKTLKILSVEQEYRETVQQNNENRMIMAQALPERAKVTGYFQAYELINKELENVYRKAKIKKKKGRQDLDYETVEEYLYRIQEFIEVFGECHQFPDEVLLFPDLLKEDSDDKEKDDFVYLP